MIAMRRRQTGGGGEGGVEELTPMEERVVSIMGATVITGM